MFENVQECSVNVRLGSCRTVYSPIFDNLALWSNLGCSMTFSVPSLWYFAFEAFDKGYKFQKWKIYKFRRQYPHSFSVIKKLARFSKISKSNQKEIDSSVTTYTFPTWNGQIGFNNLFKSDLRLTPRINPGKKYQHFYQGCLSRDSNAFLFSQIRVCVS